MPPNPMAAQVHELDKRLVEVETTMRLGFERIAAELKSLRDDLSDQGRTPPPAPPPSPSGLGLLSPLSVRDVVFLLTAVGGLITAAGSAYHGTSPPEPPALAAPAEGP